MKQDSFYYDIRIKKQDGTTKGRQGVTKGNDVADALTRTEKFVNAWGATITSAKVYLIKDDGEMELLLQTSHPPPEEKETKLLSHGMTPKKVVYPTEYGSVFRPKVYSTMVLEES